MGYRSNSKTFFSKLRREDRKVERRLENTLKFVTGVIERNITEATPVWSGQAVVNMVWSMGRPFNQTLTALPTAAGQPGTNRMPLGPEAYRGINTRASQLTLDAIRFQRPFSAYYLSNNAPHIQKLEDGQLPTSETSRAPGGMFFVTFENAVAQLRARR